MNQLYIILAVNHKDHGMNGSAALLNSIGAGMDGGFAEYLKVRTDNLIPAVSEFFPACFLVYCINLMIFHIESPPECLLKSLPSLQMLALLHLMPFTTKLG